MLYASISPDSKAKFAKKISRINQAVSEGLLTDKDITDVFGALAQQAATAAKGETPGTKLPQLWETEVLKGGNHWRVSIFNSVTRASKQWKTIIKYLEYGTKPHVIVPRIKRALCFQAGGGRVFAMRVYHPGTRPYPMFATADKVFRNGVDGVLRQIARKIKAKLR